MRKFNVFSPLVVVAPNETFEWVLMEAEGTSVTMEPVTTWPLTAGEYIVEAGTPLAATAANQPNVEAAFTCEPLPNNVTSQKIVVASQGLIDVCQNVNVMPGDYFIWKNDTAKTVSIVPDGGNTNFWPLSSQDHEVPPNGWSAVQIPSTATLDQSYTLVVTFEGGAGCPQLAQPKIIVGSAR
jgi:hypothetical protein